MNWLSIGHAAELGVLGRVAAAIVLGAAIGLEREFKDKPAGLRTHMLMSGAAALLVSLGQAVTEHFAAALGSNLVGADPLRIVSAVVTGVSFMGAGTILRRNRARRVEGLTTAASLLLSAAIGMCVGLDLWLTGVGATVLVLVVLYVVGRIESLFWRHSGDAQ